MLIGGEFDDVFEYYVSKWFFVCLYVESAFDKAKSVYESGEIFYFEIFCLWKEYFYEFEVEC